MNIKLFCWIVVLTQRPVQSQNFVDFHFKMQSQKFFAKNAKHWHMYIQAYTFKLIQSLSVNTRNSRALAFSSAGHLSFERNHKTRFRKLKATLLFLARSSCNFNEQKLLHIVLETNPQLVHQVTSHINKSSLVGILKHFTSKIRACNESFLLMYQHHDIKVILDRRLSLNLTINTLFIQHTKNCQEGNFSVQHLNPMDSSMSHTYCGFLSATRLYPGFENILIKTVISCQRKFDFDIFLSIIDNQQVETILPIRTCILHPLFVYRMTRLLYQYYYKLEVIKTNCVSLRFRDKGGLDSISIFDGPWINSPARNLVQNENIFNCASFQCLVTVTQNFYSNSGQSGSKRVEQCQQVIQFGGHELKISSNLLVDDLVQHRMPQQLCISNPCVIFMHTADNLRINTTVSEMRYTGLIKPDLSCDYGGLTVVEKSSKKPWDTFVVCSNHTVISRSIYSDSNHCHLVLFWYTEYSEIQARVQLSKTNCRSITIDNCLMESCFHHFYKLDWRVNSHLYANAILEPPKSCLKLLSDSSTFGNMTLSRKYHDKTYMYSIPTENCLVIQLFHKDGNQGRQADLTCKDGCQQMLYESQHNECVYDCAIFYELPISRSFKQSEKVCKMNVECPSLCQRPCKIQLSRSDTQISKNTVNLTLTGYIEGSDDFRKYLLACSQGWNDTENTSKMSERVYVDKAKKKNRRCVPEFLQTTPDEVWPNCAPKDDLMYISGHNDTYFTLDVASTGLFEVQLHPDTHSWVDILLHGQQAQEKLAPWKSIVFVEQSHILVNNDEHVFADSQLFARRRMCATCSSYYTVLVQTYSWDLHLPHEALYINFSGTHCLFGTVYPWQKDCKSELSYVRSNKSCQYSCWHHTLTLYHQQSLPVAVHMMDHIESLSLRLESSRPGYATGASVFLLQNYPEGYFKNRNLEGIAKYFPLDITQQKPKQDQQKFSWLEALKMCQIEHGILRWFPDKIETDYFLQWLREVSPCCSVLQDGVFIGLLGPKRKVGTN